MLKESQKNMGTIDRVIRIFVGLGSVITAIVLSLTLNILWVTVGLSVLGVILLLTSFFGFCPLYIPFGISTKDKERSPDKDT